MAKVQTTKVYAEIQRAYEAGYTAISLQGSSRSSKTYNTLIWLVAHCLTNEGTRVSIVRATLPSIKGSVLVDFKQILGRFGVWDDSAFNKSEMVYRFANGSWVEFFSTDSEQKLRGRKRDVLFVNEANELAFIEWQQLKMRTTRVSILDYNPSFSDEHWINSVNEDGRTYHFVTTYKDNPFLEATIVEEIESLQWKNPTLWEVYGLGKRAQVEGLVFSSFDICDEMPFGEVTYIGMDFGYTNDPTAIVEVCFWGGSLWIDEVDYRTSMKTGDIVEVLKSERCKGKKVISESADPRLVDEIYMAGVNIHPVRKFKGSVEAGILKMQEYPIHVTRRSANVIKELRNYTYCQDKEGRWLNQPIDAYNHAIDAVRYVILEQVIAKADDGIDYSNLNKSILGL